MYPHKHVLDDVSCRHGLECNGITQTKGMAKYMTIGKKSVKVKDFLNTLLSKAAKTADGRRNYEYMETVFPEYKGKRQQLSNRYSQ